MDECFQNILTSLDQPKSRNDNDSRDLDFLACIVNFDSDGGAFCR